MVAILLLTTGAMACVGEWRPITAPPCRDFFAVWTADIGIDLLGILGGNSGMDHKNHDLELRVATGFEFHVGESPFAGIINANWGPASLNRARAGDDAWETFNTLQFVVAPAMTEITEWGRSYIAWIGPTISTTIVPGEHPREWTLSGVQAGVKVPFSRRSLGRWGLTADLGSNGSLGFAWMVRATIGIHIATLRR